MKCKATPNIKEIFTIQKSNTILIQHTTNKQINNYYKSTLRVGKLKGKQAKDLNGCSVLVVLRKMPIKGIRANI